MIASHGNAVIIARPGCQFFDSSGKSVRVIALSDSRVNNGAKEFGINEEEAKRRVINRENRRSAFIRQSFNADLADPLNYDMVINVQKLDQDAALGAVIGMVIGKKVIDSKLPVMKATTT